MNWITGVAALLLIAFPTSTPALETSAGKVEITLVADGFEEPWSIGFLPDGSFLVTEREGNLWHISDHARQRVAGVPGVFDRGQGGLLDILVPRDFARSRELFLSFARPKGRGAVTALGVGRLSADGGSLEDFRVIFEMSPASGGGRHFGSRIVEAPDGTLFLTVGERGDRPSAQDLSRHNGSVIRVRRDGGVPTDNPFVGRGGARPEIWSYGHRNSQGAALDLSGNLWITEHGARGGDEINRIKKGANYGWPTIAYGRHYSGLRIGEGTHKEGMEQPDHYWDPSIAPSGMTIYSGKLWTEWRGSMFVGSLKFDHVARLDPANGFAGEKIAAPETGRVRDVREAPDGSIWFLSVNDGAVYGIAPQR